MSAQMYSYVNIFHLFGSVSALEDAVGSRYDLLFKNNVKPLSGPM